MTEPSDRLREIRLRRGYDQPSDAIKAFGWTNTYLQHENGIRELSRKAAERYARAFRVTGGWLLFGDPLPGQGGAKPRVRFGGKIGAGQEVIPIDEEFETINSVIAEDGGEVFEVIGESMLPLAKPGDLVFFSAPKPVLDLIGRECIVELADGRRFFKTIERGSARDLITLMSYNAEPLRDVAILRAGEFLGVKRR